MTIEELESVRYARRRIELLMQTINELDHLLMPSRVGGVHSQNPSSPVETHFRQKESLIEKLEKEQRQMMVLIEDVYAWMDTVPPKIANIVYARFILGYTWRKTARICYDGITNESVPYNALHKYLERE